MTKHRPSATGSVFLGVSVVAFMIRVDSFREGLVAFGAMAAILGVYVGVVTLIEKRRVRRTRKWPTAPGSVSEVTSRCVIQANGPDYWKVGFTYTYTATTGALRLLPIQRRFGTSA